MKAVKLYIIWLVLSLGSLVFIFLAFPYYKMDDEGTVFDIATALACLGVGMLVLRLYRRKHPGWLVVLILVLSLLLMLEEIGYGESIFGFKMPYIDGVKIDSLHDFANLGRYAVVKAIRRGAFERHANVVYPIAGLLALGLLAGTIFFFKRGWQPFIRFCKKSLQSLGPAPLVWMAVFFFMGIAAQYIDIDPLEVNTRFSVSLEELLELDAGVTLGFLLFSLPERQPKS